MVVLTSPAASAALTEGDSIYLQATANDSDGVVTKVEFYTNGTWFGEQLAAPYSVLWSNIALGTYSLTAVAEDDMFLRRTSGCGNGRGFSAGPAQPLAHHTGSRLV